MPASPRDDFGAFAGFEHMFFGLEDPYGLIREEVERALLAEDPETVVDAIATTGEPRWRTIARRDGDRLTVTYFGFCVPARIAVTSGYARASIDAALTFLFGRIDEPGRAHCRTHFDLHAAAALGGADAVFEQRFLAFRDDDV